MSFDEFNEIVDLLDQAAEAKHEGNWIEDDLSPESDENGEDMMSEKELEAAAREIFDELKNSRSDRVSIKKFKAWDAIKVGLSLLFLLSLLSALSLLCYCSYDDDDGDEDTNRAASHCLSLFIYSTL